MERSPEVGIFRAHCRLDLASCGESRMRGNDLRAKGFAKARPMRKWRFDRHRDVARRESHIIPHWAYRRASDPTAANGSTNPVMIQAGLALQTSAQIKERM